MCVCVCVQVEFRYWGLQSKVERFIHDYGLRRVMLRAHRQAWAWQDEWEGLTMSDIRRLEKETQLILQKKLGRVAENQELEEEKEEEEEGRRGGKKRGGERGGDKVEQRGRNAREHQPTSTSPAHTSTSSPTHTSTAPHHHHHSSSPPLPFPLHKSASEVQSVPHAHDLTRSTLHPMARKGSLQRRRDLWRDRSGLVQGKKPDTLLPMSRSHSSHSRVEGDSDGESMYSARPEWALDSIAMSDSDSDLEFFDAQGKPGTHPSFHPLIL